MKQAIIFYRIEDANEASILDCPEGYSWIRLDVPTEDKEVATWETSQAIQLLTELERDLNVKYEF